MKDENWDDLRLFLEVATAGGLVGAAERSGVSAPTIGRRMLALERATGHVLFERNTRGYGLAPDGEVLLRHVREMDAQAALIRRWNENGYSLPIVSVAGDGWISQFLARELGSLWTPADPFRLCLKASERDVDLTFREAEIALTDRRPSAGNVAARQSVGIAFAVYATPQVAGEPGERWISIGREQASRASDRFISQQADKWISIWTTTTASLLELARSGGGRVILPCFVGDREPALVRIGDPIGDLAVHLWITMHDDDRHRPEVRKMIDRLAALLDRHAALFSGSLAKAPAVELAAE
ncbi:LysR family transcriptional regulator [Rhizobium halophytocola]|uniref:DNA-binding transcriptional LysR family regulator n=1 Tax=Rhizobium halophytocola TaxID=735519 RepID=A0ABS4DYS2_9HYPH|nr:LysR family transcriptional regulator [Rhizobium halophytocola]MBP1850844.1 DNA-binding transcriptional LysR family regulator [Rhizobium halophytocola]